MATTKTIQIEIQYADIANSVNGHVAIDGSVICEFGPGDIAAITNLEINALDGSIDESKLHAKVIENGVSLSQQRKKALAKKFNLSLSKLDQLKNSSDPEISRMMKTLLREDKDQVTIMGCKINLKNAAE